LSNVPAVCGDNRNQMNAVKYFLAAKKIAISLNGPRFVARLLWLLPLVLGLASPAAAQFPDADVNFFVVSSQEDEPFTVGDHIVLRLEVEHPAGSQVELPQLEEEWGQFEIIEQTEPATVNNGDGTAITSKEFIVSLYEPGQYQTDSLVVTHQKPDGTIEDLSAPVIPLKIDSVLVEGDEALRDLKPQAILPVPPIWPWILAGVVLTLFVMGIMAGAGLWLYHRRRQQAQIPAMPMPVFDPRPPELVAYAELERIESLNLPAKDQFKEHYSLVTDCLRRYIEGRYGIPALERTTSEIRASFAKSRVTTTAVRDFMDLFSESDLVKFARFKPYQQDAYRLVSKARALIETTTPEPVVEPNGQNPAQEPEVMA